MAEDIKNEFRAGFEAIEEIKQQVAKIPTLRDDVAELSDDMKAVKAALRETNSDIHTHEHRLTRLENNAYHA